MSSHIHLALIAGLTAPSLLFKSVHSPFGQWLNRRQGKHGYLFANRFRLWAVRRPTRDLIAYLHNNPVRAAVVHAAADSSWTSHRFYLRPETAPEWLAVNRGLELSGFPSGQSFDEFVAKAASEPRDPTWYGSQDCAAVGEVHFVGGSALEIAEPVVGENASYDVLARPRAFAGLKADFSPEQVIAAVETVVGVPKSIFRGTSKARDASRARRLSLRVWRSVRGTQAEMAAALGISGSAACNLLNSTASRHREEDDELVWLELLRSYPQKI